MSKASMEKIADPASEAKRRRRRKLWLRIAALFVLVVGTCEIIYWTRRIAEERRQADADQRAEKIIAQAADTKNYVQAREQIEEAGFDLATLKRAMTTEIRRQTMIRVSGYFDQKTDQQRKDYLDKVINESLMFQKLAGTPQPAGIPRPESTPQGKGTFIAWVSQQPAVTRARLSEFGAAFTARVAQRGLPKIEGPVQ